MLPRPLTPPYLQVAQAASELFLDTEVRGSIPGIAAEARASGLPWAALDELFQQRLVPALVANLYSVAGEWAGFEPQWLAQALERGGRLHLPLPPSIRLQWKVVQAFYQWPELPQDWPVFRDLAHLVLEKDWSLNDNLCRLLGLPWERLERLYLQVFQPRFEVLRNSSDATSAQTQAHWTWLQSFHGWLGSQPPQALEVCQQLEHVYRIPHLAGCPRGAMVVQALRPWSQLVPACLAGPLAQLAAPCPGWEQNRAELLAQLSLD